MKVALCCNGNEYDWIAFFDFDEFLYFVDNNIVIKGYLSTIKDFDCIHIRPYYLYININYKL